MASIATGMMKKKIEQANIPSLADLQEIAQIEDVELVTSKITVYMVEIDEKNTSKGLSFGLPKTFLSMQKNANFVYSPKHRQNKASGKK